MVTLSACIRFAIPSSGRSIISMRQPIAVGRTAGASLPQEKTQGRKWVLSPQRLHNVRSCTKKIKKIFHRTDRYCLPLRSLIGKEYLQPLPKPQKQENMHLQENTLLQGGKYRIVRYISHGGFGCTYEAVNTTMRNRRVAIKELFVSDFCNRDPRTGSVTVLTQSKQPLFDKLRTKFLDEAETITDLNHPGIVRVTDAFEENGTAYYVMDYIDGHSLRDSVKNGEALSEVDALRYIRQVVDALQYVHDKKLLHLDIKPANIMINGNDRAILIDFGVSKQYDEESGENTSSVMGHSPGYAPPEQSNNSIGKFLPATDIYALGATLYHLLSGTIPPPSGELAAGEELPPLPANVSNNTRRAIQAAMTINKLTRPQSAADFLALLDGKKDSGKTHFDDGETHYNNPGKTDYEEPKKSIPKQKSKPNSDKPFPWPLVALAGIILCVAAVVLIKPKPHSGGEVVEGIDSTIHECDSCEIFDQEVLSEDKLGEYKNEEANAINLFVPIIPAGGESVSVEEEIVIKEKQKPIIDIHVSDYIGVDTEDGQDIADYQQVITDPEPEEEKPYEAVEQMPQFPGGDTALMRYISSNLNYPTVAVENGIQGTVILRFVVSKTGRIKNIQVLRSPDLSLEKEAIRIVKSMPLWNPGRQNGVNVPVYFTLPVRFKLS